eukprot:COSAG06_NODE_35072_length_465_cov_0.562842_1_plen_25_part_10
MRGMAASETYPALTCGPLRSSLAIS